MHTVALWDTGASRTHISNDVVNLFELESIGTVNANSHHGVVKTKYYRVSITLPTGGIINDIIVNSTHNFKVNDNDIGVLIGMDIIQCGNFHIDSLGEKTIFTFTHPLDNIDEDTLIETELF